MSLGEVSSQVVVQKNADGNILHTSTYNGMEALAMKKVAQHHECSSLFDCSDT
jgi:hypothetical protein